MKNIFSNKYFLGTGLAIIVGLAYYGFQADNTDVTDTTTAGIVGTTTGTNTVSNSGTDTITDTTGTTTDSIGTTTGTTTGTTGTTTGTTQ